MIQIIKGDATEPIKKPAIIAHICNTAGRWGRGFVVPLGEKYPMAKSAYLSLPEYTLGKIQVINCGNDIVVVNMIAQYGIFPMNGIPPIRYDAVRQCLIKVHNKALLECRSVHMPKIGSGLAGGDWKTIYKIIQDIFDTFGVDVYIYEYKE